MVVRCVGRAGYFGWHFVTGDTDKKSLRRRLGMRQLAKWIVLGVLLLVAGAVAAQNLSGYVMLRIPANTKKEFSGANSFADIFAKLNLEGNLQSVNMICIQGGHITADDWRYLRDHKNGVDHLGFVHTLIVEKTVDRVDNMPLDPLSSDLRADRIMQNVQKVIIHKLKNLSSRAFYDNQLGELSLPDVETMEQEVFAFTHKLPRIELPKLKSMNKDAFHDSRFTRVLVTPVLEKLSISSDFKRCYDFSLWYLGGAKIPQNATDYHFQGCPENRNIVFVNPDGSRMTGAPLDAAIAKFKADPEFKDGKWHGWFIDGDRYDVKFDASVGSVLKDYYTVPTDMSRPNQPVQVRSYMEQGYRIKRLWYEYTENGVKKTQEISTETMQFTMPNAPVTIKAEREATTMTVRVNGDDNLKFTGKGLWDCMTQFSVKVGPHKYATDVRKLEIIGGYVVSGDWQRLINIGALEELEIASTVTFVESPREYYYNVRFIPGKVHSLLLRKVRYVPTHFIDGLQNLASVRLPDVKEMAETSINYINVNDQNSTLELGLPGTAVPKVGPEPFWNQYLPRSRYLVMIDTDGKELPSNQLDNAKKLYKDYDDGDKTDRKWFGWNLDYLRVTVELENGQEQMGELKLLYPARGITGEGDEVRLIAIPKTGYREKKGTMEYKKKGETKWTKITDEDPKGSGYSYFEMPDKDVVVRVKFEPITLQVICETGLPHVTLVKTKPAQVVEGEEVEIKATLEDDGYELEENSFYYKEDGNKKAQPVLITDVTKNGNVVTGKFKMPAFSVKVHAAALGKEHAISVCPGMTGGHLETVPEKNARYGSKVSLVVVPDNGYVATLSTLTWKQLPSGAEQMVTNNSFTMPNADVQVCCQFEAVSGSNRAVFTPKLKGGRIEARPNNNVPEGAEVSLTITSNCGYVYNDFASLKYTTPDGVEHPIETTNKFKMPNSSVTVKCNFTPTQQKIEFLPMSGGTVKVASPAGTQYSTDQEVVLEVTPDQGWRLEEGSLRYIKKGEQAGWVAITGGRFPMPCYDIQIEARFEGNGHTVRTDASMQNGTLLALPNTNVAENTEVTVEPQPDAGFFMQDASMEYRILPGGMEWTKVQLSPEGNYVFKMPNASVELRAKFVSDGGNRVIILPAEHGKITANRTVNVPENFTVVLNYTADQGWDLESGSLQYRQLPDGEWTPVTGLQFLMPSSSVEVRGKFYPTGNSVFQHRGVINGTIQAFPWANVDVNTVVQVTTSPDDGYMFDPASLAWSEKGKDLWNSLANATSFKMPNSSVELTGKFVPVKYWAKPVEGLKGGQLTLDPEGGIKGTQIKVSVVYEGGYRMVAGSMAYKLASNPAAEWMPIKDGSFEMPADNVWVRAEFEPYTGDMFNVHILVESGQGRLEVRNGTTLIRDGMQVPDGAELSIARLPEAGWMVDKVLVNDKVFEGTVYTVHSDVTIKALFAQGDATAVDDAHVATVYPNPFDANVRVQADGVRELVLFTVDGQQVLRQPYGDGTLQGVTTLPAGVYVLQVHFLDGAVATQRLVKR